MHPTSSSSSVGVGAAGAIYHNFRAFRLLQMLLQCMHQPFLEFLLGSYDVELQHPRISRSVHAVVVGADARVFQIDDGADDPSSV